jgi:hypothetical protein
LLVGLHKRDLVLLGSRTRGAPIVVGPPHEDEPRIGSLAIACENEILVVHDNAYSEIAFDGYRAPSFLATPGAKDVGIEVFSLSKGYNMTGWRCAALLGNADALQTHWRLKRQSSGSRRFEPLKAPLLHSRKGARGRRRRAGSPARLKHKRSPVESYTSCTSRRQSGRPTLRSPQRQGRAR